MRLYPLSLSLSWPRAALGASLYLPVVYVTEMFADSCFVCVLLSAQSLLLLKNCCSLFGDVLPPPGPAFPPPPTVWPCHALVSLCPFPGVHMASTSIKCWWLTDSLYTSEALSPSPVAVVLRAFFPLSSPSVIRYFTPQTLGGASQTLLSPVF